MYMGSIRVFIILLNSSKHHQDLKVSQYLSNIAKASYLSFIKSLPTVTLVSQNLYIFGKDDFNQSDTRE